MTSKEELRKHFRQIRQAYSPEERSAASESALEIMHTQPIFKQNRKVACYLAFKDEFETQLFIDDLLRRHGECYLPVLHGESMKFFSYTKGDRLKANKYGILEPVGTAEITPEMLDLVFMPLLAFDGEGNRLGTGGGFYDRTFAFMQDRPERCPLLVGLGYAAQEAEKIPREEWDTKLDAVVTEKQFKDFTAD